MNQYTTTKIAKQYPTKSKNKESNEVKTNTESTDFVGLRYEGEQATPVATVKFISNQFV